MTSSATHAPGPDSLAERLAEEMRRRWQDGQRPRAEELLDRHPELWRRPEAAAELVYEEICLREEHGEAGASAAVLRRFPQWAAQLTVMLDCHKALGEGRVEPHFPDTGEALGDFVLVAELGRGSQGRVFLATQPALADRPVVLKLGPLGGGEHRALARLQHTHIVPLHAVADFPDRCLRGLCLPYFGGATLAALLASLRAVPPARRTGADLRRALDGAGGEVPLAVQARGPARDALAGATYAQAVAWVGACLAEALAYAHERGLLHLDLKPSNILLAADGQPMLLDFHLARGPVAAGAPAPPWLGGTPAYLSPEQRAAMEAVRQGLPVPQAVDGRSDVYSLGVVLYEALAGALPEPGRARSLRARNPRVSVGLADVVGRCLAARPQDRYPDAAALADDLRRHLADLPLRGVPNRDLLERWGKWRRRRPGTVWRAAVLLLLGIAAVGVGLHVSRRLERAGAALKAGRQALEQLRHAEARAAFRRGLDLAEDLPLGGDLVTGLNAGLRQAERAEVAAELHAAAERLRGLYGAEQLPAAAREAEALCRALWKKRKRILMRLGPDLPAGLGRQVRDDLLEVAVLWSDLRVRLAPAGESAAARREALRTLAEAETAFGLSAALCHERRRLAEALGLAAQARAAAAAAAQTPPRTAWEHYALGCSWLRAGELERAAEELERAAELEPQGLWFNFARGRCAHLRGRHQEALAAFAACVAGAPESAVCRHNRGLAWEALGQPAQALHDYERAAQLDPALAAAVLARDRLHEQIRNPKHEIRNKPE
jgi:eukaryotic-like serine/threonine-protein kinase